MQSFAKIVNTLTVLIIFAHFTLTVSQMDQYEYERRRSLANFNEPPGPMMASKLNPQSDYRLSSNPDDSLTVSTQSSNPTKNLLLSLKLSKVSNVQNLNPHLSVYNSGSNDERAADYRFDGSSVILAVLSSTTASPFERELNMTLYGDDGFKNKLFLVADIDALNILAAKHPNDLNKFLPTDEKRGSMMQILDGMVDLVKQVFSNVNGFASLP